MATNQRKGYSSPEDRKAGRIGEGIKVTLAELKRSYLDTDIVQMNLRMISTGYRWTYDELTGELVKGEELPIDIWEKMNKMFFNKVVPSTKEVHVEETNVHADFIKQIEANLAEDKKVSDYLIEQEVGEGVMDEGDRDGVNLG